MFAYLNKLEVIILIKNIFTTIASFTFFNFTHLQCF
jgi:hypothetical protein